MSTGTHRQQVADDPEQGQLNLVQPLHIAAKTKLIDVDDLASCHSLGDAYERTIRESGKPRKTIEYMTGITRSVMTRILSGTKNMPEGKEILFYESCGNYFAFQWKAYRMGLALNKRDLTRAEKAALFDYQQMRRTG